MKAKNPTQAHQGRGGMVSTMARSSGIAARMQESARPVQAGSRVTNQTVFLIEGLAVAFYADGHDYHEEERKRAELGSNFEQAVSF